MNKNLDVDKRWFRINTQLDTNKRKGDTKMKLNPIASNMTEVEIGDKIVLFSYKTPVAYHEAGVGYAKTSKHWSVTTSRHINKWLKLNGYNPIMGDGLREVEQVELDNLVK